MVSLLNWMRVLRLMAGQCEMSGSGNWQDDEIVLYKDCNVLLFSVAA